ncbi:MAG: protein translocase subunit SecD [Leptospiraceae bacterium]|nr:protein translocase subunit SecD [Leptospiraceae bacterium]MCP5495166.1 protein translocase subunit SecD [Leptospiraceae bacterium]
MKASRWVFLPFVVLVLSIVVLYPNFVTRELELYIHPEFQKLPQEEQSKHLSNFQNRWKEEYNKDGSYTIFPDISITNVPKEFYLVKGRFITSAKINQISQENIRLFQESKNKIRPTKIENLIKGGKLLTVKLGLDLQGGMRVVLKGDFDGYVSKLKDIYSKEIAELKETINSPKASEDEKKKAKNRLEEIEQNFELTPIRKATELEKAKLIIDNRLANQNLTEPQVRIQKDQDAVEVSLPGVANSGQILEILQNTETVEYRLEEESTPNNYLSKIQNAENILMDAGRREETEIVQLQHLITSRQGKKAVNAFLREMEAKYEIPTDKFKLYAYWARGKNSPMLPRKFIVLERAIALSGNDLANARPGMDPNNYGWAVNFELTPEGARKFFDITSKYQGRNLAIIWGNKVVSNPYIRQPIAGGHAEITGSFNEQEAIQLSNIISEGALPIPLNVLEMRFIGPTLGLESILVGIKSLVLGFILVMFYMIFYYRLAGIIADVALLANVIIMAALLSMLDYTLTLPGFAGVILTVGMAVDANVIIYERIREEILEGKHLSLAVTTGFENAFWTIFDSNITTLVAGILMVKLGNGPIKGFAITLCWGIVTSMLTSLLLSRIILEFLVNKVGVKKLSMGFSFLDRKVKHV